MKHKLSTIALSIIIAISSSNAFANAVPKPAPTAPTAPPAANDPVYNPPAANDPVYDPKPSPPSPNPSSDPKPSKWDKVKKNLKKIGKPDIVTVGVVTIGALVDYVMDPANNTATKPQQGSGFCYASYPGGGSDKVYSSATIQQQAYDACLALGYKDPLFTKTEIISGATVSYFACNNGYGGGGAIICDPQPETNPAPEPSPQPQPSPNPAPKPSPNPAVEPQPQPQPSPSPNPAVEPQPQPSPSPNPAVEPQPQPSPSPNPAVEPQPQPQPSPSPEPEPSPQPSDKPQDESKPFELPEFCDWATKVCDFIDWLKQEPPEPPPPKQVPKATLSDLGLNDDELFKQRIRFEGQCPKHELKFAISGKQIIEPIPTHHFCNLLEQVAPWLLAFSYLSAGFFVIRNL